MSNRTNRLTAIGICSLALLSWETNALAMPQELTIPTGLYVGFFGGGGSLSSTDATQRGTAFYLESSDLGGPLSVNVDGHLNSHSTGFGGAHVGFGFKKPCWFFTPSIELEGYYLGSTLNGHFDSATTALPEHNFDVSLPMHGGVFLVNTVFTFDNTYFSRVRPYVGAGIGGAALRISGASATQINPPEPNVNHFNSGPSGSDGAFAGQVKAGLSFEITKHVNLFAEYRFLYLSGTSYAFGSTEYPLIGHPATSPWIVSTNGLRYNFGAAGIEFSV